MDTIFFNELIHRSDIYRNTGGDEKIDDYGNVTISTPSGEFPIIRADMECLIIGLTGTRASVDMKELGLTEGEAYIMYFMFDEDVKKSDYIKSDQGEFIVVFVNDNIAEQHHKEAFMKKVDSTNIDNDLDEEEI